jgi:hypothetical protein
MKESRVGDLKIEEFEVLCTGCTAVFRINQKCKIHDEDFLIFTHV